MNQKLQEERRGLNGKERATERQKDKIQAGDEWS